MDMNNIGARLRKDSIALPYVKQFVHILLVDHDIASLVSLTSQFEEQLYKVTATPSATFALSLFEHRNNYYDIVIVNISMPEMSISEFAQKLQRHTMTIPIIGTSENSTKDLEEEALDNGVCHVLSKPLRHRDIANVWQHIHRVTGELPGLFDMSMTNYFDTEKDGNPSTHSSRGGAARNQEWKNTVMKMIHTDKGKMKRKNIQIAAETPDSSTDHDEEIARNSTNPRIRWTSNLHQMFLQAINFLGEQGAQPKNILAVMNVPGLTYRQVASHLQKYRAQTRKSLNLQNIFAEGQNSGTENLTMNQEPAGLSGHLIPEIGHLNNGWEGLNHEPASAGSGYEIPASGHLQNNGLQVPQQDSVGASSDVKPPKPLSSLKRTQAGEE